jgi:hypothetical protein
MRYLFPVIAFVFLLVSCGESPTKENWKETDPENVDSTAIAEVSDTINVGKFQFEETDFDFGTISEGEVVKHVFKFVNVGKVPLVITEARGSCGCTIPSYPKEPIAVGATSEIEVQFNSKNKAGANQKFVSIVANTFPEVSTIGIKANVIGKDDTMGPMAK